MVYVTIELRKNTKLISFMKDKTKKKMKKAEKSVEEEDNIVICLLTMDNKKVIKRKVSIEENIWRQVCYVP